MWKPDFNLFLKALQGGKTPRPVLYDFLVSEHIAVPIAGHPKEDTNLAKFERNAKVFAAMGYDYAPTTAPPFGFRSNPRQSKESARMNDTMIIEDWADFERYEWPEPDDSIPEYLEAAAKLMPEGAKLFFYGPNGVLENVSAILGFDNLMYKLYDDPALVKAVVDGVGSDC